MKRGSWFAVALIVGVVAIAAATSSQSIMTLVGPCVNEEGRLYCAPHTTSTAIQTTSTPIPEFPAATFLLLVIVFLSLLLLRRTEASKRVEAEQK